MAGHPVFALTELNRVARIGEGQVYLPLPVGRYLVQTGTISPGPNGEADGYSYAFRSAEERTSILAAVFGTTERDISELRRWARWILTLSRGPVLDPPSATVRVPIPSDVQRELARFRDVPELRELAQVPLAPHLLHRVRLGISRFSDLGEA